MIWKTPISLEEINRRSENTAASYLNVIFTEIGDNYLVASIPVNDTTKQPLGILHGGISVFLAETVGSCAANFCVDQKTHYCVGLDINANHIKAVKSGVVSAKASPIHLGRSTQVWEINITNDAKERINISRLTMAVMMR